MFHDEIDRIHYWKELKECKQLCGSFVKYLPPIYIRNFKYSKKQIFASYYIYIFHRWLIFLWWLLLIIIKNTLIQYVWPKTNLLFTHTSNHRCPTFSRSKSPWSRSDIKSDFKSARNRPNGARHKRLREVVPDRRHFSGHQWDVCIVENEVDTIDAFEESLGKLPA